MDYKTISSQAFEQIFNDAISTLKISDCVDPEWIKEQIYTELVSQFPDLCFQKVDIYNNRFEIVFPFQHDYQGIIEYDQGDVRFEFCIRTKRTQKLESVSKTKNKYVHTMHTKPVVFSKCLVSSSIAPFHWKNDNDPLDLAITSHRLRGHDLHEGVKGKSVNEILSWIPETYEVKFRSGIVQPFIKQHMLKGHKFNAMQHAYTEEVHQAFTSNGDVFAVLADFILEKKFIS